MEADACGYDTISAIVGALKQERDCCYSSRETGFVIRVIEGELQGSSARQTAQRDCPRTMNNI
jgi:hypothetical protein